MAEFLHLKCKLNQHTFFSIYLRSISNVQQCNNVKLAKDKKICNKASTFCQFVGIFFPLVMKDSSMLLKGRKNKNTFFKEFIYKSLHRPMEFCTTVT